MSFSQMTPRLFGAGPFLGSTPIHSFNDPWLGVGIQLTPIPQGLLRILAVAVPSWCVSVYCVPALAAALATQPYDEGNQSLLSHVCHFGKLYLNPSILLAGIRNSDRKAVHDMTQRYQTNLLFTRKQGTKMKRRFQRFATRNNTSSSVGQWGNFLRGREKIIIDDVSSELTSQSDARTIRAGHAPGPSPIPLRHTQYHHRQDIQPTGKLDRHLLLAEIESKRYATKNKSEMINMLDSDSQASMAGPSARHNRDLTPSGRPHRQGPGTAVLEQHHHTNRGRIPVQNDVERLRDEQGERLQAQLLNDNFLRISPVIAVQRRDDSADFLNDLLTLSDAASSSSSSTV